MKKKFRMRRGLLILVTVFSFIGTIFAQEAEPINYVLIFQTTQHDAKITDTIDYFFNQVLKPEDNLVLFTPQTNYNYSQQTRQTTPLKEILQRTQDVLKKDISLGAANFTAISDQMEMTVMGISQSLGTVGASGRSGMSAGSTASSSDLKNWLIQYRQLLENLLNSRKLNQNLFLDIANMFQEHKVNNHIFLFYQKEMRVIPNREAMENLRGNSDLQTEVNELFEKENTKEFLDANIVGQALKEAGAKLHFIYLQMKVKRKLGTDLKENSTDVYNSLAKIARETGGTVVNTSKPESELKKIVSGLKK